MRQKKEAGTKGNQKDCNNQFPTPCDFALEAPGGGSPWFIQANVRQPDYLLIYASLVCGALTLGIQSQLLSNGTGGYNRSYAERLWSA